ncbi:olfactory receptor 8G17-like [Rhinophrynus dorsalis]
MEQNNQSMVTYFILKGISELPELQVPIFLLVLSIYLFTVSGNMIILLLVCLDPQLHTPMYFFLGNLSVLDLTCCTVTLHKILFMFITGDNTFSVLNCKLQMYLFSSLTSDELLLLTAMSYDRYVAICKPLHYPVIMSQRVCILLSSVCWIMGFIDFIPYLILLSNVFCYKSNIINHFYCDLVPIMNLACSDISVLEIWLFIEGLFIQSLLPFLLTFVSYVFIIISIIKISTSYGRHKAFYTCSSHLTVVILLYVTLFYQYQKPMSMDTLDSNKLSALFNTVAVPVLNPLIYSLRNKDVKAAFRRLLSLIKSAV